MNLAFFLLIVLIVGAATTDAGQTITEESSVGTKQLKKLEIGSFRDELSKSKPKRIIDEIESSREVVTNCDIQDVKEIKFKAGSMFGGVSYYRIPKISEEETWLRLLVKSDNNNDQLEMDVWPSNEFSCRNAFEGVKGRWNSQVGSVLELTVFEPQESVIVAVHCQWDDMNPKQFCPFVIEAEGYKSFIDIEFSSIDLPVEVETKQYSKLDASSTSTDNIDNMHTVEDTKHRKRGQNRTPKKNNGNGHSDNDGNGEEEGGFLVTLLKILVEAMFEVLTSL
eukprot:TRINITY_DN775858_c0_g1_i1.p1 TRINITY_DN775858_c0_g1~~TRINITY_DN775858_c0_g1_i1.p1  ORF type:complete len:280 (+),score=68.02 TRINITY_DN775858_c0_g1_i1:109-948(+)